MIHNDYNPLSRLASNVGLRTKILSLQRGQIYPMHGRLFFILCSRFRIYLIKKQHLEMTNFKKNEEKAEDSTILFE